MKTGKLRNKILIFALPITLIPFVLTAFAVYYFVIRSYELQAEDEQNKILAETVVGIRREQEAARRDVALIANLPDIVDYLQMSSQPNKPSAALIRSRETAARATLQLFFDQNPYYLQLTLIDAQGEERVKLSKLPGSNPLRSIKDEDLFRRMVIARGSEPNMQMPVELLSAGHFTSTFSSRVRRDVFGGIVVLDLNTTVFERRLRPLLATHRLSIILFDDRGRIFAKSIAGADEETCFNQINLVAEAKTLLTQPRPMMSPRDLSHRNRNFMFFVIPAESLISYSGMESKAGEKWFLGVLRPKGALAEQTRTFQVVFFLILIGALGAVIWATTRYSRRVIQPLEQMAEATTKIARGQFDINLGIKTGDEVEELAVSVKKMAHDLRNFQAELIKSAKLAAIGEMASEVSHEIQNRISGLSLWIQYLDAEIDANDPKREYLQEMKHGLQGFLSLLADLKQFYRTPILELSDADVNGLVHESLHYVNHRVREEEIEVELRLAPDLPRVPCDVEKIKTVILNLLINAVEAGGNRIAVKTAISHAGPYATGDGSKDGAVMLSVEDNGVGIAESDLPRIFYPFHSTKAGGSGLGLAIVSNLITAHGGQIEVQSQPGRGSRFTIIFKSNGNSANGSRPEI